MKDLTVIVTCNPTGYATYVRSAIKMEAAAEATKVRLSLMTRRAERQVVAEERAVLRLGRVGVIGGMAG